MGGGVNSALAHDILGVCWQDQARTVQERKRKAVVPHGMHGLAPWFSVADSHVLPLVHSVEKLDVYSPVHGLSISEVTQILQGTLYIYVRAHVHLYLAD